MSTEGPTLERRFRWAAAVVPAGAVVLTWNPAQPSIWQWLILASAAIAITWLLRTALPVLLTVALLALSHSALQSPDILPSLVYPVIAVLATVALVGVVTFRIRQTVRATRASRIAAREQRQLARNADSRDP